MLILHRKKGETLLVGDNIRITVTETGSDGVKLAIEAPKSIRILRGELEEAAKVNQESVINKKQIEAVRQILPKNKIQATENSYD